MIKLTRKLNRIVSLAFNTTFIVVTTQIRPLKRLVVISLVLIIV